MQSASAFGGFKSIAPGTFIEIYGSNFAKNTRTWTGNDFKGTSAPTLLDEISVTIGGQAAFVYFISPTQVNVQVPSGVGLGMQAVVLTAAGTASAVSMVNVNPVQPGLLAPSSFNFGGKQYAVALFPDDNVTYVLPPGTLTFGTRRAKAGDVITLFGIGFGPVAPAIPAGQIVQQKNGIADRFGITIGNTPVTILYAGLAPGLVGLYQFNVVVPSALPASDAVPVTFTLGGLAGTQTLYLALQ